MIYQSGIGVLTATQTPVLPIVQKPKGIVQKNGVTMSDIDEKVYWTLKIVKGLKKWTGEHYKQPEWLSPSRE